MRPRELAHLVKALLSDPRSRLRAKVVGWSTPMSYEALHQLDVLDVLLKRWAGKSYKPVPRPSDKSVKKASGKSPSDAMRQLRPHLFQDDKDDSDG